MLRRCARTEPWSPSRGRGAQCGGGGEVIDTLPLLWWIGGYGSEFSTIDPRSADRWLSVLDDDECKLLVSAAVLIELPTLPGGNEMADAVTNCLLDHSDRFEILSVTYTVAEFANLLDPKLSPTRRAVGGTAMHASVPLMSADGQLTWSIGLINPYRVL